MAADIFAKLGDIKGESLDDKHKGEIEVLSYSRGVTNAGSLGAGTGGGAGKATFRDSAHFERSQALVAARYVDNRGAPSEVYPYNPNGSPQGLTSFTTPDGRFTVIMPHPERVFRTVAMSWHPEGWGEDSPWMRMFRNARVWVG